MTILNPVKHIIAQSRKRQWICRIALLKKLRINCILSTMHLLLRHLVASLDYNCDTSVIKTDIKLQLYCCIKYAVIYNCDMELKNSDKWTH